MLKILSTLLILTNMLSCESARHGGSTGGSGSNNNNQNPSRSGDPTTPNGGTSSNVEDIGGGSLDLPCIKAPQDGSPYSYAGATPSGLFHKIFYYRNVAVDPGNTNRDPSNMLGYTPYNITIPSSVLSKESFELSKEFLVGLIQKETPQSLLLFAASHQFGNGKDTVKVTFTATGGSQTDTNNDTINSGFGVVTAYNLRVENNKPIGDVKVRAWSLDDQSSVGGVPSQSSNQQDPTRVTGPLSSVINTTKLLVGIDLTGFKIDIELGAKTYDSVQYRSVHFGGFFPKNIGTPTICK